MNGLKNEKHLPPRGKYAILVVGGTFRGVRSSELTTIRNL